MFELFVVCSFYSKFKKKKAIQKYHQSVSLDPNLCSPDIVIKLISNHSSMCDNLLHGILVLNLISLHTMASASKLLNIITLSHSFVRVFQEQKHWGNTQHGP